MKKLASYIALAALTLAAPTLIHAQDKKGSKPAETKPAPKPDPNKPGGGKKN